MTLRQAMMNLQPSLPWSFQSQWGTPRHNCQAINLCWEPYVKSVFNGGVSNLLRLSEPGMEVPINARVGPIHRQVCFLNVKTIIGSSSRVMCLKPFFIPVLFYQGTLWKRAGISINTWSGPVVITIILAIQQSWFWIILYSKYLSISWFLKVAKN